MNLGNTLLSVGALVFSICLFFCYLYKSKQTGYFNLIFLLMISILIFVIISEIGAIYFMSVLSVDSFLASLFCHLNTILTILWVFNVCCYLITFNKKSYKSLIMYFQRYDAIKILSFIFAFVMILSIFLPYKNVSDDNGAYIYGMPQVLVYASGIFGIILAVYYIIKNKEIFTKAFMPVIGLASFVSFLAMGIQLYYPYQLVITASLVYDVYLLYFAFENPDLYLLRELDSVRENYNETNNVKSDFLSNMTYEIRTPINAILGFSEGIFNSNDYNWELVKSDIEHIESSSKNLLDIINNILDASRIESEVEKIETIDYDVEKLILEAKDLALSKIITSEVKFKLDVDPNVPKVLNGDVYKIKRMLLNLINNAVKYTEVGQIILSVRTNIVENMATLHVKVYDTGIGLTDIEKNQIKLYFSGDINSINSGKGLGLVIVKRLVDILHGLFSFDSSYGAGSTFCVDIPQMVVDSTPIGDINNKTLDKSRAFLNCTNLNIMVVDDNKPNLTVIEKLLAPYNCNVVSALSGRSCIDYIKKGGNYDLILLDYMMPEMDGIEVLHILQKLEGFKVPPIVVLTANVMTGMKEIYLGEGFDDYLAKPIDINELDRILNKYLYDIVQKSDIEDKYIIRESKNSADYNGGSKVYNIKILEDYGVDYLASLSYISDIDSYNEIMMDFYNSLSRTFKELSVAKIDKDYLKYSKISHTLKVNSQSLGFMDFKDMALQHEEAGNISDLDFINDNFEKFVKEAIKVKRIIEKYLDINK